MGAGISEDRGGWSVGDNGSNRRRNRRSRIIKRHAIEAAWRAGGAGAQRHCSYALNKAAAIRRQLESVARRKSAKMTSGER